MLRFAMLAACAVALAGCATVVRGSTERFDVQSAPAGALAKFMITPLCDRECLQKNYPETAAQVGDRADWKTSAPDCVTPCSITLQRSDVVTITLIKEGHLPRTVMVRPRVAKSAVLVAGNAVIGGAAGLLVDAASGATLDHCPNPLMVTLLPVGSREAEVPISDVCVPRPEDDVGSRPAYRD